MDMNHTLYIQDFFKFTVPFDTGMRDSTVAFYSRKASLLI